ncbi:hypothetical protein [Natrinema salaciae]|uniref:hypothetical protein n=1 Tax=Natrinema salaciae TaxID=1186196 RepID=UPI00111364F8|nr:hypothetical protein [Natrinema salaciae]
MYRRGFLGVSIVSFFGGCLLFSSEGGGHIRIKNETETPHTVEVTLVQQSSEETVLNESYSVDGDSQLEIEDAFNGGVFDATVSLDDGTTETFELGVGRCPGTYFTITVEPGGLSLEGGAGCD